MGRIQVLRAALASFLLLSAGAAGAQQGGGPPGGGTDGPTEVGVVALASDQVPVSVTLPGRAVAFEDADIRPRVSGVIEEVAYRPGVAVAVGDPLFRIEDDSYLAEVAAAEATVAGAEAGVQTARATVERYRTLEGSAISQADRETAEAALSQAEATLASARSALQTAQLDLERTEIRSPIDGIPSVAAVSVGELVTANQAEALATVTRLDPIYVDVTESSARMMRVREQIAQGTLAVGDELGMRLVLETGDIYEGEGRLVTPGTTVSTTTGTVDYRVQFPNPDHLILPGQFLRVEVTLGTSEGILVPQRATSRAASGELTAFLAEDGVARQVVLTTSGTYSNAWVTDSGVEPGDLLIVDGLRDLRDGAEIATVPVVIGGDGVVQELTPEGGGDAPPATAGEAPQAAAEGEPVERADAAGATRPVAATTSSSTSRE
ncbi:efflux RND transporter periplasmic adaptor subunit [Rubellimicrobium aerolatum]|uniref:Efflux RND transporter periplasmic adaptor subunit n=1 Tax=Rubellimicrobium aerolatum TaxID=490979 RepID=A0ABW0S7X3_9RHOB|nr:efflux RND transporter periplasmic adaptor subunit [Rubellimicrobium aerolatum]MBP1804436.1 membrane fusion protein (multidrug efflux system) [Rubellimicrobium aerolatum]